MAQSYRQHLLRVLIYISIFLAWCPLSHAQVDIWSTLNQKSTDLYLEGKYDHAVRVGKEALSIAERDRGPDHPETAVSLNNLAEFYRMQGQYISAAELLKRALAINQKALGHGHPSIATGLNNLALISQAQGQYVEAEGLFNRSLAIREMIFGPIDVDVAQSLNNLASLYQDLGQLERATPIYLRALNIREKILGPVHLDVAGNLNNLATLYFLQGELIQAEVLNKRALSIFEKILGPDHPDLALSLGNQAFFYAQRGQYEEAEPLYIRSLRIKEKFLGIDHPAVANALINLADLYENQRQYAQAEPIYKRSILILEKVLGPDHPNVALPINNLAGLYAIQGRHDQAEPLYLRSLKINANAFGSDHIRVGATANNLALMYATQGRYEEAELLYSQSMKVREKALGPDHPDIALSLNNIAYMYAGQNRYSEAESKYKLALAIYEKVFGKNHPSLATTFDNLSSLYVAQGYLVEGLDSIRSSSKILIEMGRIRSQKSASKFTTKPLIDVERFERHALLISKLLPTAKNSQPLISESFSVSQYARVGTTGSAFAQMASRSSASSANLAKLAREHQDAVTAWEQFNKQFVDSIGKPENLRSEILENVLRKKMYDTEANIKSLNIEIQRDFPQYFELVSPEPLSVADAQKFLGLDEALVSYLVTEKETLVWVIRPKVAQLIRIGLSSAELSTLISTLRNGVNLSEGSTAFPIPAAHELYQSIFAPIVTLLTGVKHVMIVADGPLQSIPFGILVTKPVSPMQEKNIPWLIREYAFTNLPAVTSLRALRQYPTKKSATEPFVGFGDPLLNGTPGEARGVSIAKLFSRGAIVDSNELNTLSRLPETADELKAISETLKAKKGSLYLGEAATEQQVKSMDLMPYRVIAFATHGLLSGEFKGLAEPSLVLTPPKVPSDIDDGLLTASEVASLKLNADLVILSACNTAGSDGKLGAEGFSGLAKAFIYAGSRTLLVSHWAVDSIATVPLTTNFLEEVEKGSGRAEALRRSMLAMIDHPTDAALRQPAMWGPFIVVGEGSQRLH